MSARGVRILSIVVGVLVTTLVVGLGGWLYTRTQSSQPITLPLFGGSFGVGRTRFDWLDDSRLERLGGKDEKRELAVFVWYPADPAAQAGSATYLPGAWATAHDTGFWSFLVQNPASVRVHAVEDAPLSQSQTSYPVLIFQPGLGPNALDYTVLAESLASRGYVVVASTPTYSASLVAFANGSIIEGTTAGNVPDDASPKEATAILDRLLPTWTQDNRFVLAQVEKLGAGTPANLFAGHLDLNALGVFGHSFGGASALESCSLEPRFKACADLDGYPYGEVIQQGLKQPFMVMWSEPDKGDEGWQQAQSDTASLFSASQVKGLELTLQGAKHFNFADAGVLFSLIYKLKGALGSIDGSRALDITVTYLADFFDATLRGSAKTLQTLLQNPLFPEVSLTHHGSGT